MHSAILEQGPLQMPVCFEKEALGHTKFLLCTRTFALTFSP